MYAGPYASTKYSNRNHCAFKQCFSPLKSKIKNVHGAHGDFCGSSGKKTRLTILQSMR